MPSVKANHAHQPSNASVLRGAFLAFATAIVVVGCPNGDDDGCISAFDVDIRQPERTRYSPGETITFMAVAGFLTSPGDSDEVLFDASSLTFEWSEMETNRDLGTGPIISVNDFDEGIHTVQVIALRNGQPNITGSDQILIFVGDGAIQGQVWQDTVPDGIRGPDEPPIQGASVSITTQGILIATELTNEDGMYAFNNLPSGAYVVAFATMLTTSTDLVFVEMDVGEDDTIDSDANPSDFGRTEVITLESGGLVENVDAGATLLTDDDPSDPNPATVTVEPQQITMEVGATTMLFASANQLSGSSIVWTTSDPAVVTIVSAGPLVGTALAVGVGNATITATNPQTGAFAQVPVQVFDGGGASVSGIVWVDENRDGIRTPDEAVLSELQIDLLLNEQIQRSVLTDANGMYRIDGITPDSSYTLVGRTMSSLRATLRDVGGDDTVDNDFAQLAGLTAPFRDIGLSSNEVATDIDLGLLTRAPDGNRLVGRRFQWDA